MRILLLFVLLPGCVLITGVFRSECGNGRVEDEEECDDGNSNNNSDSCLNTCKDARCGDSFTHIGVEGCDDGNDVNGDGCNVFCRNELLCGNGALDVGEACDDGNVIGTDACTTLCSDAICGDSFIQSGEEQCDDANDLLGDGCRPDCTLEACGDGIIDRNELCLDTRQTIPAQAGPNRLAANDLNGDDHIDVAVASNNPSALQIFLGDGAGNLAPQASLNLTTSSNVGGMTILDLNRDSQLDVVAGFNTNNNTGLLVVALQDLAHNFTLSEISNINIGQAPREIIGEDLTGDEAPDLLIASEFDGGLRSINNAGNGLSFTQGLNFPGLLGSFGLTLADFNQDGLLDLVHTGGGVNSANLYFRASQNSFQSPLSMVLASSCIFVVAGDFDEDGKPDFATSCLSNGLVDVLTQGDDNTFSPTFLGTPSPGSLVARDVNADDLLDLIVANQNVASVAFFFNTGSQPAFNAIKTKTIPQINNPTSIAVEDFNEDGAPDLITTNLQNNTLTLLLSDP